MKYKFKHKLIIIIPLILILMCSLLFVFQIKFGSINIPRIIYATITVNNGKNDYFIVKDNNPNNKTSGSNSKEVFFANPKKVIIATPNNNYNFSDYAESIGYNIIENEQYGSKIVIENNNNKEEVFISTNQYYSLWQWY